MPEIAITEAQKERLEEIRSDVEDAFVDTYGHVPLGDAFQYLLDTYTPPGEQDRADGYDRITNAEFPDLQEIASEVEEVPGSGISADDMRGRLLSKLGPEEFAARLEAVADDSEQKSEGEVQETDDAEEESETEETDQARTDDGTDTGDTGAEESDESAEADDTADESADELDDESADGDGSPGPGGGGGVLATANQLLREHDDKWREASGEEPYEVDLPDGTTEAVRTKDDVRQLLFRHY